MKLVDKQIWFEKDSLWKLYKESTEGVDKKISEYEWKFLVDNIWIKTEEVMMLCFSTYGTIISNAWIAYIK